MEKIKLLLLMTIIAMTISVSTLTESYGFVTENETEYTLADSGVNTEVSEKDAVSFWDNLKKLNWWSIVSLLIAGGLGRAIFKVVKEGKDVKVKYIEYTKDGTLDTKQKDDLIKELGEFILAIDGVWMILKKIFTASDKKK